MPGDPSLRPVRVGGVAFAALYTLSLTLGLGDLVGAFADSGASFGGYVDQPADRVRHGAAAYLLTSSAFAFVAFVVSLSRACGDAAGAVARTVAVVLAGVFGTLVCVAAAALATVSMSIGFGTLTGDPGIQDGQDLLPQLGYVLLAVPGALAAGTTVWLLSAAAGHAGLLPKPVVVLGQVAAVAQLGAFYFLPLVLMPTWVLLAALTARSPGRAQSNARAKA